jgi:hypothetical protein
LGMSGMKITDALHTTTREAALTTPGRLSRMYYWLRRETSGLECESMCLSENPKRRIFSTK